MSRNLLPIFSSMSFMISSLTCYCSVTQLHPTLCNPMVCSTPGFPVLHHVPEFAQTMSIGSVMPFKHLILCPPLLLPSIFPSITVFSIESVLPIRWPEYWSFSCSLSPSSDYSGLISFRIDWFDLLAVQGTPKSFQPHSLKSSVQHSTFFIVQLSHLYMTTGKNMVLIIWTFLGKIMSLLFNMLSRFVIAFLPWSKHLLISWVQSPSTVILWPKKIKSVIGHCFHCFLICLPWIDGTRWHELHFLNVGF